MFCTAQLQMPLVICGWEKPDDLLHMPLEFPMLPADTMQIYKLPDHEISKIVPRLAHLKPENELSEDDDDKVLCVH